jgi:hypothetical protein
MVRCRRLKDEKIVVDFDSGNHEYSCMGKACAGVGWALVLLLEEFLPQMGKLVKAFCLSVSGGQRVVLFVSTVVSLCDAKG